MKLKKFYLPSVSLFLLILLAVGQLSTFSHGIRIMKEEVGKSWEGEYSSSTGYFPKISPSQAINYDGDNFDPIYGVSHRAVPQGPNPLHN